MNDLFNLNIVDENDWHMLTGSWRHDPDGTIQLPVERAEEHLAFHRHHSFQDMEIRFQYCSGTNFSDTGVIFRARDTRSYYVVHFPTQGQAHRVRRFWAAVSKVDNDAGWTRLIRLGQIRGVQSEVEAWHDVIISVAGDEIRVSVDGRRFDPVKDQTFRQAGRIGLMGFTISPGVAGPKIRNLSVRGTPATEQPWDTKLRPGQNWFDIFPTGHWQRMASITRAPNGRLLLLIPQADRRPVIVESEDQGRTWTLLAELNDAFAWKGENAHGGVLHTTRNGKLMLLTFDPPRRTGAIAQSCDNGKTWSDPQPMTMPDLPESIGNVYPFNPMLETKDGTLLWTAQSDLASAQKGPPSNEGFVKTQAQRMALIFRSTDEGQSWTWINMMPPLGYGMFPPEDGGSEINLAQLPTGEILALNRPEYSATMWEMRSRDDGLTWSPPVRSGVSGYAAALICTKRGDLLSAHRLPGNTVNLSRDGGLNWDAGTQVGTDAWAQGIMYEVAPDQILYVYMDSWETSLRGQLMRVTSDGIQPIAL